MDTPYTAVDGCSRGVWGANFTPLVPTHASSEDILNNFNVWFKFKNIVNFWIFDPGQKSILSEIRQDNIMNYDAVYEWHGLLL